MGTVANSTSTMHKIQSKPITMDCFETDDFVEIGWPNEDNHFVKGNLIPYLEFLRKKFVETENIIYWKELIRWLPESWLQTRTITMNYENLLAMCSKGQRRNHKLNEWSGRWTEVEESFIQFARSLPYAQELIFMDEINDRKFPKIDFI